MPALSHRRRHVGCALHQAYCPVRRIRPRSNAPSTRWTSASRVDELRASRASTGDDRELFRPRSAVIVDADEIEAFAAAPQARRRRDRAAARAARQVARRPLALADSFRLPTIERTWLCRKDRADAAIVMHLAMALDIEPIEGLLGRVAWQSAERKVVKSCGRRGVRGGIAWRRRSSGRRHVPDTVAGRGRAARGGSGCGRGSAGAWR